MDQVKSKFKNISQERQMNRSKNLNSSSTPKHGVLSDIPVQLN